MRRTTLGLELRVLNGRNDSGSYTRKTTLSHELMALNGKNDSRS